MSEQAEEIRWFLLPNEAQEYLLGRDTPLTTNAFMPKKYATKPDYVEESGEDEEDEIAPLPPNMARVLERRSTFRKSVRVESDKLHPLEKKTKKRRKFWFFSSKKTRQRTSCNHVINGEVRRGSSRVVVSSLRVSEQRGVRAWASTEVLTDVTESSNLQPECSPVRRSSSKLQLLKKLLHINKSSIQDPA